MSTDAGNAAAPEDAATREETSERPGLESSDPQSADSATSTPDTADRGTEGSAPESDEEGAGGRGADADPGDAGSRDPADPAETGFVTSMLRDSTITGLPGETGAPPVEPHSPEAQQEGDEPVGSEPDAGDDPHGTD